MPSLLEHYYAKQPEPLQGCLLALKDIVLGISSHISQQRKFQIPFFYYKDKKLCFLWVNRKKLLFGFVEDKSILPHSFEARPKDKMETVVIDPNNDIPMEMIIERLQQLMRIYDKKST